MLRGVCREIKEGPAVTGPRQAWVTQQLGPVVPPETHCAQSPSPTLPRSSASLEIAHSSPQHPPPPRPL